VDRCEPSHEDSYSDLVQDAALASNLYADLHSAGGCDLHADVDFIRRHCDGDSDGLRDAWAIANAVGDVGSESPAVSSRGLQALHGMMGPRQVAISTEAAAGTATCNR
jgi:hypothetical protein